MPLAIFVILTKGNLGLQLKDTSLSIALSGSLSIKPSGDAPISGS